MATVTYLGPYQTLRAKEDAKPVKIGEQITLSQAQIDILKRYGHRFDEGAGKSANAPANAPANASEPAKSNQ